MGDLSQNDKKRLDDAFTKSRKDLEPSRERFDRRVDQYAGPDDRGKSSAMFDDDNRSPYNLFRLWTNIYSRALVSDNPRASVSTRKYDLQTVAYKMQLALNKQIEEFRLADDLELCARSALFVAGVGKVCRVNDDSTPDYRNGKPRLLCVNWKDWVHDTTGDTRNDWQFMGHRFRVSKEWAKSNKNYSAKERALIESASGPSNDGDAQRDAENASREDATFEEMIDLWELYLPTRNRIIVFYGSPMHILDEYEWEGPRNGPYHILGFDPVPGRDMLLAPAGECEDMGDAANQLMSRIIEDALNRKSGATYAGANEKDAKRITDADNGDIVLSSVGSTALQPFSIGGVDQASLATLLWITRQFSYISNNLDIIGGLSPQSGTLGQDRMLSQSASQRLQGMQSKMVKFTEGIIRDLAWYLWDEPDMNELLTHRIELSSGSIDVHFPFTTDDRRGDFQDYNFKIVPYSMQRRTPAEEAQLAVQLLQQAILPLMPMAAAQGGQLDARTVVRDLARGFDSPMLENWIVWSGIAPENTASDHSDGPKPDISQRTYIRKNIPGGSAQQQDTDMAQLMLGMGKQPAEMASMVRGNG